MQNILFKKQIIKYFGVREGKMANKLTRIMSIFVKIFFFNIPFTQICSLSKTGRGIIRAKYLKWLENEISENNLSISDNYNVYIFFYKKNGNI